ncbi:hypothetical protein T07_12745 [Trichinella nelsoni]|uniref:Uncharacterized protein n=1 Tax=Trichinella nelsoni TaxID=6336 RepID=A0A0V0S6L8_9BILA|nr:hypothetical protein T07_12745 [Trichinella nelsoni]
MGVTPNCKFAEFVKQKQLFLLQFLNLKRKANNCCYRNVLSYSLIMLSSMQWHVIYLLPQDDGKQAFIQDCTD